MHQHFSCAGLLAGLLLSLTATGCTDSKPAASAATDTGRNHDALTMDIEVFRAYSPEEVNRAFGIAIAYTYEPSDTSRVTAMLADAGMPPEMKHAWIPRFTDKGIDLVLFNRTPLLSETVTARKLTPVPDSRDYANVAFRFADIDKWAAITSDHISKRLAISVNGEIVSAPQVNMAIESGNCSATVRIELIK